MWLVWMVLLLPSLAGERTSSWDDESRQDWSYRLIEWLMEDFSQRAKLLEKHGGAVVPLQYDFLDFASDRKKKRTWEEFLQQDLSRREMEALLTGVFRELEEVRVSIAQAEAEAAQTWSPRAGLDDPEMVQGQIFGEDIDASRLGVILDNSYSMEPYLEQLRAEIRKDFPEAYIVETNGCHMESWRFMEPWFYCAPLVGKNPFLAERHIPRVPQWEDEPYSEYLFWTRNFPSAFRSMAELMHVDTIYWFCDFDDDHDGKTIELMQMLLKKHDITLYAHTLSKSPPRAVKALVEESGGKLIRKRL